MYSSGQGIVFDYGSQMIPWEFRESGRFGKLGKLLQRS